MRRLAAKLANITKGSFSGNQHVASANLQTPAVSQSKAAEMLNVSTRSVAAAAKDCLIAVLCKFLAELAFWPLVRSG